MKKRLPYLLLFPALLFTLFILFYPLIQNILNSFHNVTMMRDRGWIGLTNYMAVFHDSLFWLALKNSLSYSTLGTVLSMMVGLTVAMLLNQRLGRLNDVFKFIYMIPWVVSPVVAGFAWKWLLNDHFGMVNYLLIQLGLIHTGIIWLGQAQTALLSVIIARVWQFFPFAMIMFYAALQNIPQEEYEAAEVDGAGSLAKFIHVTLPNLKSVAAVLLLLGLIWSFNDFNLVYVMTRGGPIHASMVLPVLVREYSFVMYDLGKGSALSIVIFAVLLILSFVYLSMLAKRERI
jgi:multiple sugar transport system permease protein